MKPKTIICDIDGCLLKHTGDICEQPHTYVEGGNKIILPGALENIKEWDRNAYNIILMTGRRESMRADTVEQLRHFHIFYDLLIMGVKNGPRILINDMKEGSSEKTAFAINLVRNKGTEGLSLDGITKTPWGSYEVLLDSDTCKVKRIIINPGQAPSYQYHHKRDEQWTIVSGCGELLLDDFTMQISPSDCLFIKRKQKHQARNTGTEPLVFIETQLGEYFGEDDIVRLKDDYGRA